MVSHLNECRSAFRRFTLDARLECASRAASRSFSSVASSNDATSKGSASGRSSCGGRSGHAPPDAHAVLRLKHARRQPIAVLTAYDQPGARAKKR